MSNELACGACVPLRLIAKCGECAIKLPDAGAARQLSERARPPPAPRFGSTASIFYQHSYCTQTARVGRNEQSHDVALRTTAMRRARSRRLRTACGLVEFMDFHVRADL
jgi:hypothetical protein